MKALPFAVVTAALALAATAPAAVAAQPCASATGAANNPAFGTSKDCKPAVATTKPGSIPGPLQAKSATTVAKQDGKTVYQYGDTTIAVGGYVSGEIAVTKGGVRP